MLYPYSYPLYHNKIAWRLVYCSFELPNLQTDILGLKFFISSDILYIYIDISIVAKSVLRI